MPYRLAEGIRAWDLRYQAGGRMILDGVSMQARSGHVLGIVGPNGAGKTTLLRVLDGILRPDSGRVQALGRDLPSLAARERARMIGFMSHEMAPAFSTTVLDVVLMGRYAHLRRFADPGPQDRALAREALARVGMAGFEGRLFASLSTGERQLALFARLLAQDCPVILLDEPTSNLDIRHRHDMQRIARDLAGEGKTIVAAIHDINEAALSCDRILVVHRGTVVAAGEPEAVLTPAVLRKVYGVTVAVGRSSLTGALRIEVIGDGR